MCTDHGRSRVRAFVGVVIDAIPVSPSGAAGADGNRLLEHAAWINTRLDDLDKDARARLEQMLEIEPNEATACLEGQARAAARDILTSAEALTIYQALTPEGWEPGTRLEVKMTIVGLMDELLAPLSRPTTGWSPAGS
jgi:hypothetical protein